MRSGAQPGRYGKAQGLYRAVDEFFEQASKPAPRDIGQAHAWFKVAASRNYRRGSGEMTPQIVLSRVEQEMTDQQ